MKQATLSLMSALLWIVSPCPPGMAMPAGGQDPEDHPNRDEVLLFTYFRDNGQHGVCLDESSDGIHFKPLHDGKPVFTPPQWPHGQNLTRDASILHHDGMFHMVWTSGWKGGTPQRGRSPGQGTSRHFVLCPKISRRLAETNLGKSIQIK